MAISSVIRGQAEARIVSDATTEPIASLLVSFLQARPCQPGAELLAQRRLGLFPGIFRAVQRHDAPWYVTAGDAPDAGEDIDAYLV
jgi:hypothetical protein